MSKEKKKKVGGGLSKKSEELAKVAADKRRERDRLQHDKRLERERARLNKQRQKREKKFLKMQARRDRVNATNAPKGFMSSIRRLFDKFILFVGLVTHKRLLFKTFLSFAAILCMVIGTTISVGGYYHKKEERAKIQTLFDDNLSFSKSGSTVTLDKPQRDESNHTVILPINVTQINNLSSDAKDYKVFIRSSSGALTYRPKAQLMIFGNSGSMALIVKSPVPIPNQVVHVYIRNDRNLIDPDESTQSMTDGGTVDDATKAVREKYDVLDFTVNLGADSMKVLPERLNQSIDSIALYRHFFAERRIKDIKKALTTEQARLATYYRRADDFRNALENDGFQVPLAPKIAQKDTKPNHTLPVNLQGNLDDGFVDKDHIKQMNDALNAIDISGDVFNDTDERDREEFSKLPDVIKKNDGTTSNDRINNPNGDATTSPASYWQKLQTTWGNIRDSKNAIYIKYALELYSVQADVSRQSDAVTTTRLKQFKLIGDVQTDD